MKKISFIIIAVCVFIFFGCKTDESYIIYEHVGTLMVNGTADSVFIEYSLETGTIAQYSEQSLPWELNIELPETCVYEGEDIKPVYWRGIYLIAKNEGLSGMVTAKILIDGIVVKEETSEGPGTMVKVSN